MPQEEGSKVRQKTFSKQIGNCIQMKSLKRPTFTGYCPLSRDVVWGRMSTLTIQWAAAGFKIPNNILGRQVSMISPPQMVNMKQHICLLDFHFFPLILKKKKKDGVIFPCGLILASQHLPHPLFPTSFLLPFILSFLPSCHPPFWQVDVKDCGSWE